MTVLRIKDWGEHFENSSSRKVKDLTWVGVPLKHGTGYRRLLAHERGPALFGAWVAMVQFAARCPVRGVFARRDGSAYSASDIAIVVGFPIDLIRECLLVVTEPVNEICWIESIEWDNPPSLAIQPAESASESQKNGVCRDKSGDDGKTPALQDKTKTGEDKTVQDLTGQDLTAQNQTPPTTTNPDDQTAPDSAKPAARTTWGLVAKRLKSYGVARITPTVDRAKELSWGENQILEILDWLEDASHPERKRDIGPGAIVERIESADARFWAVEENWPPAAGASEPAKNQYPYANVGPGRPLDKQDTGNFASLERLFGRQLDEMSDLDLFALMQPIRESYAEVNMHFRRKNQNSRLDLLRKLKKQATEKSQDTS